MRPPSTPESGALAMVAPWWSWWARPSGVGPPRGQGIVEYGLILSLSALLALVLLLFFGPTLSAFLQAVGDAIDAAS